jgi:hypothetical protein
VSGDWALTLSLFIGSIVGLMMLGMPVAIAFLLVNMVAAFLIMRSFDGVMQVVDNATDLLTSYILAPVPLFLLMGALFFHTGLAYRMFAALDQLLGRLPGRLSFLTVIGGTGFSTLTGSSLANAAMLGSLLVPEMKKRGYSMHMSLGPILGTGGLAILIPPSALIVLLGSVAQVDVGKLLLAGVLPGFVLAVLYAATIAIQIMVNPAAAPSYDPPRVALAEKLKTIAINIIPMLAIVLVVVGMIVGGLATPTESAAFGVTAVVVLHRRRVRLAVLHPGRFLGVQPDSGVQRRVQRFHGLGHEPVGQPLPAAAVHVLRSDRPRHVHGPGFHDADRGAGDVPARGAAGLRSRLVRHRLPDGDGDEPDDAALRTAAVHRQGHGAAGNKLRGGGARRPAIPGGRCGARAVARAVPRAGALAAEPDVTQLTRGGMRRARPAPR